LNSVRWLLWLSLWLLLLKGLLLSLLLADLAGKF
jgi:hypothetical protein